MPLRLHHGLVVAATLAISPASAALVPYYHSGAWDAFSGPSDNGGSVCGVGTTNPSDHRSLSMRWPIGGQQMLFEANKPSWTIPKDTQVAVVLQVDGNPPWTFQGVGNDKMVSWNMTSDMIQQFDQQFRQGSTLTVSFPNGNEAPWVLSLTGSTAISNTFGRCITDLSRRAGVATPNSGPPGPPGDTQPYGQAPTQPNAPAPPSQPSAPPPPPSQPNAQPAPPKP